MSALAQAAKSLLLKDMVGAFFLIISLFSVLLLRWLERRYGRIEG